MNVYGPVKCIFFSHSVFMVAVNLKTTLQSRCVAVLTINSRHSLSLLKFYYNGIVTFRMGKTRNTISFSCNNVF